MDALDLSTRAPRSPSDRLDGLIMLARTIDKLRATLPGGNLGPYHMRGFSQQLLEELGIEESALRDAVARASGDDDVVAWVREHTDASRYDDINATLQRRRVGDRVDDPAFRGKYPILTSLPREMTLIEMLDHDDRAMFAKP
ncbi:MAG TPA: DUF5069 domain-containing protein [Candidatus Tyrphobacter sp.]